MDTITILLIALALAMDAFAVAVASGVALKAVSSRQTFRLAWHFGWFQFLMPVIGWTVGTTIYKMVEKID
ncbi:MAG: manganese efflux pump, partial [candidate division KSB1 bacterium]|nr:manganese efflux pump [candidate division KSB1 bacterium]